jgi:hypothetical protein
MLLALPVNRRVESLVETHVLKASSNEFVFFLAILWAFDYPAIGLLRIYESSVYHCVLDVSVAEFLFYEQYVFS